MNPSRGQITGLGAFPVAFWPACLLAWFMVFPVGAWGAGYEDAAGNNKSTTTVNNRNTGFGIDPASACSDANLDGKISYDECNARDWSQVVPIANQNGAGVSAGTSTATIGQTSTQDITSGPHSSTRYYNAPSKPGTTATTGYSSSAGGASRSQHNEYGFEIIVDKKTDPLEPYYQRFSIPYYTVDSQTDANGNMVGQASVTYEKVVTESDPGNPGVFNRYTVTGTATSAWNGTTSQMEGSYSSTCESGCPTDANGYTYDPETGWTHPWQ